MDWASIIYLGTTFALLVIFLVLAVRTYSRRNRSRLEEPKRRMLDDD
jgi:hypothetical protein